MYKNSPAELLEAATRVIAKGSGMPQVFNDEAVIPALEAHGVSHEDAMDYAIVGCVELTTQGNALNWSRRGDVQPRQGAGIDAHRRRRPAHR